ncbi:hypothetical protein NpNSSI1_00001127 [Neofusicoccum parvum]|nr:hypothetical protein NpNSSI1_00001127 [Neofusicoccum parvum]
MLVYFYYGDYSDTKLDYAITERILLNIEVYTMGDRYEVADTGLCEDACRRIRSLSTSAWNKMKTSLHVILQEAYKKTRPGDSFLHPLLVEIAAGNPDELVMDKNFCEAMDTIGEFGWEIPTRQSRYNKALEKDAEKYKTHKLKCPRCKCTVRMFLPAPGFDGWWKNSVHCIVRGDDALFCGWKKAIVKT